MKTLTAVDLFCGAGGFSTGMYQAAESLGKKLRLVGVNHWPVAIDTHGTNHPDAELYCESLDSLDPRKVMRGRRLDILLASPECIGHSRAKGGKPVKDQSRATAWHVLRWAEALNPRVLLAENVREFMEWGPVNSKGYPIKKRKGEIFQSFISALVSLGYSVKYRVLNAANYGDATTRERLFIVATKARIGPRHPDPSHAKMPGLLGERHWRSAREIIDWSLVGAPIHLRKKPLADATMRRIEIGIRRYWGEWAEPFIVVLRGTSTTKSVDVPLPTVTAGGGHFALIEPFLTQSEHGERVYSIDAPMPTITASSRGFGIVEPFMLGQQSGSTPRGIGNPAPTIAISGAISLVEPLIINYYGNGSAKPVSVPLDTITTKDRFALVEAGILGISYRMFQPHELSAAMSFPSGYKFSGTKTDVVRQIGNAVPVRTAKALIQENVG